MLPIRALIFKTIYRLANALKGILAPLVPANTRYIIKSKLLSLAYPTSNKKKMKTSSMMKGINLVGYARAEMGIGESCRIAARSIDAARIPFCIFNFTGTNRSSMSDTSWAHKEVRDPVYDINIVHLNAEQMVEIYSEYGDKLFINRYTIGYWHWELPDFPDRWLDSFSLVNEIWAPSNFVADSIAQKSPVPVVKIPHSVQVLIESRRDRDYFGLPSNTFLFLCMFDLNSYQERKNPQGVIDAFKIAFQETDARVGLVIKINGHHNRQKELKELQYSVKDSENIFIIAETLSRNDTNALISVVDCYVSLHRSEGFGLGMAEAMYLGKPTIGTGWSGNTEFMNPFNSCLVNYELVQLGETFGPYEAYQYWAEPDLEHAAHYMRRLTEDHLYYKHLSEIGRRDIITNFSPEVIGDLIKKRLTYINKNNLGG